MTGLNEADTVHLAADRPAGLAGVAMSVTSQASLLSRGECGSDRNDRTDYGAREHKRRARTEAYLTRPVAQ
jgi:hypothetical protein